MVRVVDKAEVWPRVRDVDGRAPQASPDSLLERGGEEFELSENMAGLHLACYVRKVGDQVVVPSHLGVPRNRRVDGDLLVSRRSGIHRGLV